MQEIRTNLLTFNFAGSGINHILYGENKESIETCIRKIEETIKSVNPHEDKYSITKLDHNSNVYITALIHNQKLYLAFYSRNEGELYFDEENSIFAEKHLQNVIDDFEYKTVGAIKNDRQLLLNTELSKIWQGVRPLVEKIEELNNVIDKLPEASKAQIRVSTQYEDAIDKLIQSYYDGDILDKTIAEITLKNTRDVEKAQVKQIVR